jgi:hypothetical protein
MIFSLILSYAGQGGMDLRPSNPQTGGGKMAQEQTQAPASGLLLEVDRLPEAVDRSKAGSSVADNDGNDG